MDEAMESNKAESEEAALAEAKEKLGKVGIIKSTTNGRIRLQLRPEYRTPETMALIREKLAADERVKEVTINERTGSVVVTFGSEHSGHRLLYSAFSEAELIGEAAFDLPEDKKEAGGGGGGTYGKLDQQAADLMIKVDQAVYKRSGGKIHTRGRLFPLTIAGLGVVQMAIYGISLEMLPGPLLIWLAHDIHRRFGKEHEELAEQEALESGKAAEETTASSPVAGGMVTAAA